MVAVDDDAADESGDVFADASALEQEPAKGSAKDGTWAGLAAEVRYWGQWVLDKVRAEIGDLYPPIPDPAAPKIEPHTLANPPIAAIVTSSTETSMSKLDGLMK